LIYLSKKIKKCKAITTHANMFGDPFAGMDVSTGVCRLVPALNFEKEKI